MTNTPETLNILNPDFRMPEHCGGDRWSILHGDSLQILRQFEPNSFDAIITDPPYASGGSSQTTKNRSTNEKYSSMSKDKALPDFDSDQMDQLSWMFWTAAWLQDARRIAKPGAPVCLFIDWRQLPAMTLALQWAGWTWRGVAVWDKVASRPQKGRFRQQSEYIVWGSNGKMPLERNVGCLPGVFRYPNPQNRIHVTEKPLQLMRDVVQICEPGGRILDPFAGAGTTVLAAVQEGYEAVGIEMSDAYFRRSTERLKTALESEVNLVLEDAVERSEYTAIVRDKLLRCPMLVVCSRNQDATTNAQIGLAQKYNRIVTTLDGLKKAVSEGNDLVS